MASDEKFAEKISISEAVDTSSQNDSRKRARNRIKWKGILDSQDAGSIIRTNTSISTGVSVEKPIRNTQKTGPALFTNILQPVHCEDSLYRVMVAFQTRFAV